MIGIDRFNQLSQDVKKCPTRCVVCQREGASNLALMWAMHTGYWDVNHGGPLKPGSNASGVLISLCDDCDKKPDAEIAAKAESLDANLRKRRSKT